MRGMDRLCRPGCRAEQVLALAAALLEPHVRPDVAQVVRHHSQFTARHWEPIVPGASDPRDRFAEERWFGLACQFVDEWDMKSLAALPEKAGVMAHPFEPVLICLP